MSSQVSFFFWTNSEGHTLRKIHRILDLLIDNRGTLPTIRAGAPGRRMEVALVK
jgi:hypothetical protein